MKRVRARTDVIVSRWVGLAGDWSEVEVEVLVCTRSWRARLIRRLPGGAKDQIMLSILCGVFYGVTSRDALPHLIHYLCASGILVRWTHSRD